VIVVHSAWVAAGGGLYIWAEEGGRPKPAPAKGSASGGSTKARRVRPHPFALDVDGVGRAIAELAGLGARDTIARATRTEILVMLPESHGAPISSPWLEDESASTPSLATLSRSPIHEQGSPTGEAVGSQVSLATWMTPAILLPAAEAADLLFDLPSVDRTTPSTDLSSGVVAAYDMTYAASSAELVLELLTRGRVLPTLDKEPNGWFARWRPLVDSRDRKRIEMLHWALPASFCAASVPVNGSNKRSSKAVLPAQALRTWMWALTDALARRLAAKPPIDPAVPGPKGRGPQGAGVAEAWMAALRSVDGRVEGDDDDLLALSEAVRAWNSTIDTEAEPVRTCFRIVPPPEDSEGSGEFGEKADRFGNWRVEFALQAVDDPSLFVPAETIWADGPELVALERHASNPDEHLLRGLGRAARLVPSIGSALVEAEPFELRTDATGALAFLRDGAPLLEQAGFGVLAPPWWKSSRARIGLRMRSSTPSPPGGTAGGLGLDALCEVRWEAALGDDVLSLSELKDLAKLKQPLVRLRGQWVELRDGDIAAAIAAVGKKTTKPDLMSAGEVLHAALGLGSDLDGHLPIATVDAQGWLGDLLAGAEDRRLEPRATPEDFSGELRPYQERGLGWLAFLGTLGLGACLADDMGLGKTAQLLALVQEERRTTKGPTLVICPMSLVGNWQREAARFTPDLEVYVHHGSDRLDDKAFTRYVKKMDLVLSTYGLASRDRELLSTVTWNRLVLDEAQQIKNSAARTTQSVRSIPASRRIAMTGTPVENRLGELWSIMEFLNPGLLGTQKRFRERFAIPIERNGDEVAAERLRRVTAPFVLRRLKTDGSIIADLPEKLEMKEYCNLTREQATLYQAVVEDMLARIDDSEGIERRGLVLATMMKLKQVCNHPAHFLADGSSLPGRSGKLARLTEVLDEAASEGDKALVFTQFAEMGTLLERHLQRQLTCDVFWLHGGIGKKRRDAMVEHFQSAPGPAVFLLSLKAGGTGLNLTAATHVVHFDRWWNPAVEDQATDRAFRIGQRRNVQVRKFVCAGTLEERIDEMIESKRALAQRIVGTGEGWITEMSTADLREVINLSADAVAEDR
jgi:SNF2-related domain/SNF2 Helicase protein/Helicase conserved C-terminal domain